MSEEDYIYKFYIVNENNLAALSCSSLWFSVSYDFNDPFEGAVLPVFESFDNSAVINAVKDMHELVCNGTLSENNILGIKKSSKVEFEQKLVDKYLSDKNLMRNLKKTFFENFIGIRENLLNNSGMCSFSVTKYNNKPIDNILMWSHYGAGFKGFCIKYNKNKILKSLPEKSILNQQLIEYSDKPIEIDVHKFTTDCLEAFKKVKNLSSNFMDMFFMKHKSWEYESELRLMNERGGLVKVDPKSIEEIYLGGKMANDKKELVFKLLHQQNDNISFFESQMKKSEFGFEHHPFQYRGK